MHPSRIPNHCQVERAKRIRLIAIPCMVLPTPFLIYITTSIAYIIPGTAVKYPHNKQTIPPPRDSDPSIQNSKRQNSIAIFTLATRKPLRERPISIATGQRITHPRRNCPNVHGQTASARAQMGSPGETRC